jgi:hypothetical protein
MKQTTTRLNQRTVPVSATKTIQQQPALPTIFMAPPSNIGAIRQTEANDTGIPPAFHGFTGNYFQKFLREEFDIYAAAKGWDSKKIVFMIPSTLQGPALSKWLQFSTTVDQNIPWLSSAADHNAYRLYQP